MSLHLARTTPLPTLGSLIAKLDREVAEYERLREKAITDLIESISELAQECARAAGAVTEGHAEQVASTRDRDNWFAA